MIRIVFEELSPAESLQDIGEKNVLSSHLLLSMLSDTECLARDLVGDPLHNRFDLFRSHTVLSGAQS